MATGMHGEYIRGMGAAAAAARLNVRVQTIACIESDEPGIAP